jgi:hypothetical protein
MPVGMSELHLGAHSIVSLLPCLDVLVVGIEETEFVLKDRAISSKPSFGSSLALTHGKSPPYATRSATVRSPRRSCQVGPSMNA